MAGDASLTPDHVEARSFTTAFRGYDQSEVRSFLKRVSNELRSWIERSTQLEVAWHSAEERAARPPVLDEDTLMAAVGEETAAILRAARAAAGDLRSRAAQESEKAVTDGKAEAERIRDEAKDIVAREALAAEEGAKRILDSAKAEVAEMVDKARVESESIRGKAEQERVLTIQGANSTRDRILDDLARRRRVATVQIEQLRAGRERLIESYAVVRRTLEEAQSELSRADAEARAAADDVGRRLRREQQAEEDLASGGHEAGEEFGEAAVAGASEAEVEAVRAEPVRAEYAEPAQPAPTQAEPAGPEVAGAESARGSRLRSARRRGRRNGTEEAGAGGGDVAPVANSPVEAPDAGAVEAPTTAEGSEDADGEEGGGVDQLFARIRAGQPEPGDGDSGTVAGEAAGAGEAAASEVAQDAPDGATVPDAEEGLLQRREASLVNLEGTLTRKLKRALQDDQNDLLDRLRGIKGAPTVEKLLPSLDAHVSFYAGVARDLVTRAVAAGGEFAAESVGAVAKDVGAKGKPGDGSVEELAADAGRSIVDPLRRRLEQAIALSPGDDDSAVLVESVGAAYREWKTQRIEGVAGDVLAAAFARGTWEGLPEGASIRWVVEDVDGPCPDCDDDALAGNLTKGDKFPTGQHHPPAHSGCRCLLVPVGL